MDMYKVWIERYQNMMFNKLITIEGYNELLIEYIIRNFEEGIIEKLQNF